MFESPQSSIRRSLVDGGSIVLLLSVAIASGYVILSPWTKSAPQAALVGSVIEVRPEGPRAPVHTEPVAPSAPAVATPQTPKPIEPAKATETPKAAESPKATEVMTTAKAAAIAPVRPTVPAVKPWR